MNRPLTPRLHRWIPGALVVATLAVAGAGCPPPPAQRYEWQGVLTRLPGGMLSVWGFSATDVYTVGADSRDGNGPTAMHYDGTRWTRLDTGVSEGDLWWVHGVSREAVYMVGSGGMILRYNPTARTFERMRTPGTETLYGVWGSGPNDVWAVGGSIIPGGSSAVLWHFDGAAWTAAQIPMEARDKTLFKVWGRAANDVWAVGQNSSILHYDGSAWTVVPVSNDARGQLLTVHVEGNTRYAVGGTGSALLLEGDGASGWRRVTLDGVRGLNGVWVPAMGNPVAVGANGTVLHRHPERGWREVASAPDLGLDFHAVWVDPTGAVWAVGGQIASSPMTDGVIYHFGERVMGTDVVLAPTLRACPDTRGSICTWVGSSTEPGFNGDMRHRRDSALYWPVDAEFSPNGQLYVLDWNNHRVRRVRADDTLETVVGNELPGDGDPATADLMAPGAMGTDVALNHPTDLLFEPDGALLVAAWHNHKIRRLDPNTGRVVVIAGRGPGFVGDGALVSPMTRLRQPSKFARDREGNLYVLDQGNLRVRRFGRDGMVSTVAGDGMRGFAGDGGPALMAQFSFQVGENPEPEGDVVVSPDGARLFVADSGNHRVRVIDLATGTINTFAGTGTGGFAGDGGPAAMAQLYSPRDLEIGPDGNLWVADTGNHSIRVINLTTNTIRTVVGVNGAYGFTGDRGPAAMARLNRPFGINFDRAGNLYVSDTFNNRVRRVVRDW